jgi:hypothetical protein
MKSVNAEFYHSSPEYFEKFDNLKIKELGFHFGTRDQAFFNLRRQDLSRDKKGVPQGYLYKCRIDLKKVLPELMDLGDWSFSMIEEYFNFAKFNEELFSRNEWRNIKNVVDFKKEMIKKGFDGIEYENCFEGKGLSLVVFDAKNIKIKEIERVKFVIRERIKKPENFVYFDQGYFMNVKESLRKGEKSAKLKR